MHHITPIVENSTGKMRLGKGFSPDELKEAGVTMLQARQMAIRVDRKRRTCREENIQTLQSHLPEVSGKPKK